MPCPYFFPTERMDSRRWPGAPIMPLGDPHAGLCRIFGQDIFPVETELRDLCNFGYARGRCSRFPDGDGPDAVRFGPAREGNSVVYVIERDHRPVATGVLMPAPNAEGVETLDRQAQAYLLSWLRRRC